MNKFVGEFKLPTDVAGKIGALAVKANRAGVLPPETMPGMRVDGVLSTDLCRLLQNSVPSECWVPVAANGYLKDYEEGDPVGSWRASCFNEALATVLWQRIAALFPSEMDFSETNSAPTEGHALWKPVGLNPLMRYIRYEGEGLLVPHYDGPFVWTEKRRTLMSLVLYLTTSESDSGRTRFIRDDSAEAPDAEKDYSDWARLARPDEVIQQLAPKAGSAIMFNHRLLHDSEPLPAGHTKTIIRTDVVFEAC